MATITINGQTFETGSNPAGQGTGQGSILPPRFTIINGRAVPTDALGGSITTAKPVSTGNPEIDKINAANFANTGDVARTIDVNKFQGSTVSLDQAKAAANSGVPFSQRLQNILNTYNQKDTIASKAASIGNKVSDIPIQVDQSGNDINQRRTDLLVQNAIFSGVDPKTLTPLVTPLNKTPTDVSGVVTSLNHALASTTDNSISTSNATQATQDPNNPNKINVTIDPNVASLIGDQILKTLKDVIGNQGTITQTPNGATIDLNPKTQDTTQTQPTDFISSLFSNPITLIIIIVGIVIFLGLVFRRK